MNKVLMISYYWPPAGGISVLRTLKIAKYLRHFGWEPIVYTTRNASYPYIDKGNEKDVPENLEVLDHDIMEPFGLFKKLSGRSKEERLDNILQVRSKNSNVIEPLAIWLRANFFIPDARALWIRPSVKYLSHYLKNNKVDAIFSDGPPHTNTVIANKLAKKFNIPWLADFQDPWTQVDYYQMFPITKIADRIHRKMEQRVFNDSVAITIASPTWKQDLEDIGAKNVEVLYYGYDEEDFDSLIDERVDGKIVISHAGLFGIDRYPNNFFLALKEILEEENTISDKLLIKLYGQVDFEVKSQIDQLGLNDFCEFNDFVPRKEVLKMNSESNLLLLPLNKATNANGRIPGKLFEYLRSGTPIMAFGPEDGDAAQIISDTGTGICIAYENFDRIKSMLKSILLENLTFDRNSDKIEAYSNYNQTRKVASILNKIAKDG